MNYRHAERFIGLMALMVVVGVAQAENRTWPATVVSLEGNDWKVAADPKNAGREEGWWKGPVADARPVRVPGIMQEALPGYHGVAWYWREFIAPESGYADGRCLLRFDTVDYLAQVWVNDIPVVGEPPVPPTTTDPNVAGKIAAALRIPCSTASMT